jgi:putative PIN family toxin of toxin-antitoxin system
MIVVLDTSTLAPAIIPISQSRHLINRLVAGGHTVAVNQPILRELLDVLSRPRSRRWHGRTDAEIAEFVSLVTHLFLVTPGDIRVCGLVPDDPDDDIVLAAAIEIQAEFIVSDDAHLLDLGTVGTTQIVSRATMHEVLDKFSTS